MQLVGFLLSTLCMATHAIKLGSLKKCLALSVFMPLSAAWADFSTAPWDAGVKYEVVQAAPASSPAVKQGDLVVIRFKGSYKGNVFDDTFKTDQPYFYRAGVGSLVKGLDDAVTHMKVGDRWKLEFGGDLGFGAKGKPSSPGKPRIPPFADLAFEVRPTSTSC